MREREIKNAKIARTMLGYEDHGIFTAMLTLEWGGGGQGFGGYGLDQHVQDADERIGTAAGLTFVMRCCETVGVQTWEELKGKYVRIDHDWQKIHRIGHITDEKWFDPGAMFEQMHRSRQ